MAKKKTAKTSRKRSTKKTQGEVQTRAKSSRGRSDDFKSSDQDLSQRWRQNRAGRDLAEGNYSGKILSAKMGKHFSSDAFIFSVKISTPEDLRGREVNVPFPLKTPVGCSIFGDALGILGYDPEEVDEDQFSAVAREVGASGETIHFQATKSAGKQGGIFTNYRLVRPRPE